MDEGCNITYVDTGDIGKPHHTVLLYVILVFGLVANGAVLFVVGVTRELRTSANIYIVLLCVLNIMLLITNLPMKLKQFDISTLPSLILANICQYLLKLLSTTSIVALVFLSFGRWQAVVKPMWNGVETTKGNTIQLMVVLLVAAIINLPWAFAYEQNTNCNQQSIDLREDYSKFVIFYGVVVLYLIPLLFIGVFYLSMARKLCTQSNRAIRESIRRNKRARALRSRVALVVLALVFSFAICWFPHNFVYLMFACEIPISNLSLFLFDWQIHAFLLNTCVDPLCVFILGSRFRTNLIRTLHLEGIFGITAKRNMFRNTFNRNTTLTSNRNSGSLALKLQSVPKNEDDADANDNMR